MKRRDIIYLFAIIVLLFSIIFINYTGAVPNIEFISPTPNEGIEIINTSTGINASIRESNLSEFKFNWNGINHTFYDDSLILMMNFDNISALGENNTRVFDASGRGNNGTLKGSATWTTLGRYNGAIIFDGNGDYVNISTSQDFNFSNKNWTMSMWINPSFSVGYQALLVKRLSAFSQNDWGLWAHDTNSTEFIYGNNKIIKVGAAANNSEWSQLVLTKTTENVTTISFTNNSNLINTTDNDGLAYNGTDLFLTLDANISRYNLSGSLLSSSTSARCGFNSLNYGGAFYKDNFIYTIIGNSAPPWEVYVLKIDPADFSCDQFWNVTASLSYLGNAIFYMNGSWFIGETGIPSIATKKIIRFNDNFEKLDVAITYPGHENVGFQDATVYHNKAYVTDHSGNIYVLSYQSDGTLKEEYKLVVSTGNTYMEGITTVGDTFFIFEADQDKIKNCSLNENTVEGGRLRMYINNIPQDSHPISDSLNYSTNNLFVGAGNNPTGSHYYNGTIDEVRIYNRTLSADEVRMQYYSNLQKFNGTQWYFYNNITNLTDGTYTYYGLAKDNSGNYNSSEIRTLTFINCAESWSCTDWSSCLAGTQTRTCTDVDACGTITSKPAESQNCKGSSCSYKWDCTNWSECFSSGEQTRNCTNVGTCPDIFKTPTAKQNCNYTAQETEFNEEENEQEIGWLEGVFQNRIIIYPVIAIIIFSVIFYFRRVILRRRKGLAENQ